MAIPVSDLAKRISDDLIEEFHNEPAHFYVCEMGRRCRVIACTADVHVANRMLKIYCDPNAFYGVIREGVDGTYHWLGAARFKAVYAEQLEPHLPEPLLWGEES